MLFIKIITFIKNSNSMVLGYLVLLKTTKFNLKTWKDVRWTLTRCSFYRKGTKLLKKVFTNILVLCQKMSFHPINVPLQQIFFDRKIQSKLLRDSNVGLTTLKVANKKYKLLKIPNWPAAACKKYLFSSLRLTVLSDIITRIFKLAILLS